MIGKVGNTTLERGDINRQEGRVEP